MHQNGPPQAYSWETWVGLLPFCAWEDVGMLASWGLIQASLPPPHPGKSYASVVPQCTNLRQRLSGIISDGNPLLTKHLSVCLSLYVTVFISPHLRGVNVLDVWLNSQVCKAAKKPHKTKIILDKPVSHYLSPAESNEDALSLFKPQRQCWCWLALSRALLYQILSLL